MTLSKEAMRQGYCLGPRDWIARDIEAVIMFRDQIDRVNTTQRFLRDFCADWQKSYNDCRQKRERIQLQLEPKRLFDTFLSVRVLQNFYLLTDFQTACKFYHHFDVLLSAELATLKMY